MKNQKYSSYYLEEVRYLVETLIDQAKHYLTSCPYHQKQMVVSSQCKFSLPFAQIYSALSHQGVLKYMLANREDFS